MTHGFNIDDKVLQELAKLINERKKSDAKHSYVAQLFTKGEDAILKKIGEEATEVVMAAKNINLNGSPQLLVAEVADLWFHCLVVLAQYNLTPQDIFVELQKRFGVSGLEEKASRALKLID